MGEIYYLDEISASNSDLKSQKDTNYDDDSWFFGVIDYTPNTYGVDT